MQIAKIIFQQGFQDLEMSIRRQVKITSSLMPKRRTGQPGTQGCYQAIRSAPDEIPPPGPAHPKTNFC